MTDSSTAKIAGLAIIVASVAAAALLRLSPSAIVLVAAVACVAVGISWGRADARHTARANRLWADQQDELLAWQNRWNLLHVETRQSASVLLQMTDGVIVLAPDWSVQLFNPSARRLLAIRGHDSLLGRPFPEVVRIPEVIEAVRAVLSSQDEKVLLVEVVDAGHIRPLRIRVDRIETAAESNVLLTVRDETESRRVEEMRREFVANVSHELKTPLAAIKGYAETVELAIEDDPQAATHFMSQIRTQCLRLERLVADMMQLARAQAGRNQMRLERLGLADLLAESERAYLPLAKAKQIELTVAEIGDDVQVLADAEATLTIANNLIGNAIRYTPEGGHVHVAVSRQADRWAVQVSDDGPGIARSEQERIFERFYRVEKTRESASGGTGLGLAIVKNLTLAQDGEVRVRSRPGEGATFEVSLMAADDAHQ